MKTGIHALTREQYDALPSGHKGFLNFSSLKHIGRSPAAYRWHVENRGEATDAMRLGTASDIAALQPELYEARVAVWRGKVRNGKEWDAFQTENRDKTIITAKQDQAAREMADTVRRHPVAGPFLKRGTSQVTAVWEIEEPEAHGLPGYYFRCKGLIDRIVHDEGAAPTLLIDLKTSADASPAGFGRTAYNLGYHCQGSWYQTGLALATGTKPLPVMNIVVESEPPYPVSVFYIEARELELGRERWRGWLETLAHCVRENHWPEYLEAPASLELPRFAYPQEEIA
jgi:hypothetical protein